MPNVLTTLRRWRMNALASGLIFGLMALLLALFYRPYVLSEPLFDIPASGSFTLTIALPLLALFGGLALLRPDLALGCVILTTPLVYRSRGFWDGNFPFISDKYFPVHEIVLLIVLGATALTAIPQIRRPNRALLARLGRESLLPGLWLLAGTFAATLAVPEGRAEAWREWRWMIAEPLVLYGLLRWHLRPPTGEAAQPAGFDKRRFMLVALLLSGVGVALIGLLQRRGIDLTPIEGAGACHSDFIVNTGGTVRTSAVFCHPNNLALWLDRVWPVALVLLAGMLTRRPRLAREWIWAGFYAASLAITVTSMLYTYSKGARFAGAAVALALSLLPRRWWFATATALILGGALAYSSISGPERLNVTGDSSFARLSIWRSGLAMYRDHPLTGIGLDQFYFYYQPTFGRGYIEAEAIARDETNTSHPHNIVLDLLLRVGPFGLIIFAALAWRTTWRGWRIWRSSRSGADGWMALAALAALAVGLLHGLVDQGYFSTDLAIATWFLVGLIDSMDRADRPSAPDRA